MKLRNPSSRNKLNIKSREKVLDVGGGHNPHPRANVVVDKFVDDNSHRSGDIHVYKNQQFIHADGENLPFENKSFDYVICNHVLEHVDNPQHFLEELFRVGKRGYIETPSLFGEYLFPKKSHVWAVLEIDNKIVLMKKEAIGLSNKFDFGGLFQNYLPKNSIGYKILERTHPDVHTVRIEWKDRLDYIINPDDKYLRSHFENTWTEEATLKFFRKRGFVEELYKSCRAFASICKSVIKSKVLKKFNLINVLGIGTACDLLLNS